MNVKPFILRGILTQAIFLAVALVATYLFMSELACASVAVGAAISAASFFIIALVVGHSFSGGGRAAFVAFIGIIKMGILGAAIWWLLGHHLVLPLAFLIGFSTMVLALVIEGMRSKAAS